MTPSQSKRASQGEASKPAGADESPTRDWTQQHLWEFQPLRDIALVVLALACFKLGAALSIVTVPLLLAMGFAYLIEPMVAWVQKHTHVGRKVSAALLVFAALLLVVLPLGGGAAFALVESVDFMRGVGEDANASLALVQESWTEDGIPSPDADEPEDQRLPDEAEAGRLREHVVWGFVIDRLEGMPESSGRDRAPTTKALDWLKRNWSTVAEAALPRARDAIGAVTGFVLGTGNFFLGLFLTCFFAFFMSASWPTVLGHLDRLIPERSGDHRSDVRDILKQMNRSVAGFLRGRLTIALILGIFYAVGYAYVGVPVPVALGGFVGFLTLVPYLSLLGAPIALTAILIDPSGVPDFAADSTWWLLLAPLAVYVVGQLADDWILSPLIQSRATNMDTPFIVFASIAGGAIGGIFGLLLAIPLVSCCKILWLEVWWPRVQSWVEGERVDPLPLSRP